MSLFASADGDAVRTLDVHQVLESSLQVAANEIRHCAALERAYEDVPHVQGNAAKLAQVFLNLILNAVFAIREAEGRKHVIRVSTSVESERVLVTVHNTASSLSAASRASMFDPLASINSHQAGLHFGLVVSREVIDAMGGSIEVEATHSRGVAFRVRLPRCTPASYPAPTLQPLPRPASILVVDDEPLLCELFAAMLRSANYAVTVFSSPRAALTALREGSFDLVLCDVMMPDLSGIELYEQLCPERPEMASRFVFITGGAFTERARSFLKRTDRPILRKPCSRSELLDAVGHMLVAVA